MTLTRRSTIGGAAFLLLLSILVFGAMAPGEAATGDYTYRVNAGGDAIDMSGAGQANFVSGHTADLGAITGLATSGISGEFTPPIEDPWDLTEVTPVPEALFTDTLYVSEGGTMSFDFDVIDGGNYVVSLYFGENNDAITAEGDREFDVSIEGVEVLSNYDMFAESLAAGDPNGYNYALKETFDVTATGDVLTISIFADVNVASIRGIDIVEGDNTAPVISVTGANPQQIAQGSPYTELGATWTDDVDGGPFAVTDIDASAVNTAVLGSYTVYYNAQDAAGNDAVEATRTVTVVDAPDTTDPVITLLGANPQMVGKLLTYVELGATATDDVDGDLTGDIVIDASLVNTSVPGNYLVSYTVEDSAGNDTTVNRTVMVVDYFTDDNTSIFERDINAIAAEGITKGCNPPANDNFCPDDNVTRGQFAAFIARGFNLPTPPASYDPFTDDDGNIFEGDIERLAYADITRGCNPPANDNFCPDQKLTRGEAAAMFVRAFGYTDNGGGDLFIDDDGSVFENDIDKLATAGVTKGCNPPTNDMFCPNALITRGQIAAFVARAFGL